MKKYWLKVGLIIAIMTVPLVAQGWGFYWESQKKEDLNMAARWLIETGVDVYATEGKDEAERRLLREVTPELRRAITLSLKASVVGNRRQILGGGVSGFSIDGSPDSYRGSAGVMFRTEIAGELYELWRTKIHTNRKLGRDTYDSIFLLAQVVKGSEKRLILHHEDKFFEEYEVAPGQIFRLPVNDPLLVEVLAPNTSSNRRYFVGTSLENKKIGYVDGKFVIVTYDGASEDLKRRKKKLKSMTSLAWWFPKEGISVHQKKGEDGLNKQFKSTYLDLVVKVNEDAYENGAGKAFSMEGDGVLFDIFLLYRTEVDGEIYEYWFLDGTEQEVDEPLKSLLYIVAKVDASTAFRELLQRSEKPITTIYYRTGKSDHLAFHRENAIGVSR